MNPKSVTYLRNFIFGVEDSLVSTVGLLSGIAIANVERGTILLTGVVLIFVEAFSMAAGSFLSEHSAQEYATQAKAESRYSLISGAIMFASYFVSGFIPLLPYLLLPVTSAFYYSIAASLVALFVLGLIGARLARMNLMRSGFRMFIVGGIAIAIGIAAGQIVN